MTSMLVLAATRWLMGSVGTRANRVEWAKRWRWGQHGRGDRVMSSLSSGTGCERAGWQGGGDDVMIASRRRYLLR